MSKIEAYYRQDCADEYLKVAMGVYPAALSINKFGTNEVVGTTYEDLWLPSGVITHITAATTLEVASSHTDDTSAGTGAQTVHIDGYDANYDVLTEIVSLNGNTPVVTSGLFLGVNRAHVEAGGSGEVNAGDIYIADDSTAWSAGVPSTASAIQAKIGVGYGQTQIAMYTVPANKSAYITNIYVTAATGKTITFRLLAHYRDLKSKRVKMRGTVTEQSPFIHNFGPYLMVPEKTTLHIQALVDQTTAAVSGGFDLILVDN